MSHFGSPAPDAFQSVKSKKRALKAKPPISERAPARHEIGNTHVTHVHRMAHHLQNTAATIGRMRTFRISLFEWRGFTKEFRPAYYFVSQKVRVYQNFKKSG